ncbi:squalene/phytoene synthase family protein [Plastorhodobacter daqingensis]|uniref:Squalene/phytoene synthase family protein n=1 Tax=Plastorhodobacter daqingensis TaxID=1387281 RepID=A0ABW2UK39_9RHOB
MNRTDTADLAALAQLVERGDPDRFLALMAAPPAARAPLLPLYAFNLEVARAAWASSEPMIAEMRLQFWQDTIEAIGAGTTPRGAEVIGPLAAVIRAHDLPLPLFAALIEARRWDIYRAPFADAAAFEAHLQATAGNLMWLAALALGAPGAAEPVVRDFAQGAGLANWLMAVPALEARGRIPLVDGRPGAVAALARSGLGRIRAARARRADLPRRAAPALLPGWQAGALLAQAARDPRRVADGGLAQSEFARRGSLLLRATTGRW